MFFDSWSGLLRVVVLGFCAYLTLVVALRLSGRRTLAKMNAFDLVVTVALGSTLATVLLTSDVALAEGTLALVLLIGAVRRRLGLGAVAAVPRCGEVGPDVAGLAGAVARPGAARQQGRVSAGGTLPGAWRTGPCDGCRTGDRRLVQRHSREVGR